MELFNYLYFTCQKKINDMNLSVCVVPAFFSEELCTSSSHAAAFIQDKMKFLHPILSLSVNSLILNRSTTPMSNKIMLKFRVDCVKH